MSTKVITYDVGTTSLKACLFHVSAQESVRFIASTVFDYDLQILGDGAIEQRAEDWWMAMCETTAHLLEKTGTPKEEIEGISFCSQMQNMLLVDKAGHPVRPALSWMDSRAEKQFARYMKTGLQVAGINLFKLLKFIRITGVVSAGTKDPVWKYHWVRENEPETFARAHKWLDAKEYLTCRASGVMKASRDIASATFLYDTKKRCWSEALCKMLDVDIRHLPDICECSDNIGGLLPGAAEELGLVSGIAVFSGGSDISLCQIGAGALEVGDVNVYSGTSGWVVTTVDKLHLDVNCLLGALVGADPSTYNYVAEIDTSGKCMEWVKDRIDLPLSNYEQMTEYIKDTPAGSNGVIFSPWMHGNRCPFEDPNARGLFFNLDLATRGSDLVKAVIEGVCMHMRWLLVETNKAFRTSAVVRFTGGSAVSPYICQVLADVLNREVEVIENPRYAGAMGAAALTAVGFGLIPDIKDVKKIIRVDRRYTPNPENTKVYDRIFPIFQNLYKDNKKSFAALNSNK